MGKFDKLPLLYLANAIIFLFIIPRFVAAQNVTSPYSILGIGDIDTKDFGRYFASGNTSIARRDFYCYNFLNPASLTALPFKTMHFDISVSGRSSSYTYPTSDVSIGIPSNDFIVKRISMAFRVSQKTGIAFGLKPYSSVNYSYFQNDAILDGNTPYIKQVEGSGGINQVYFSAGKMLTKRISAGVTASWLFGSLERTTQYISPSIALNISKNEIDFYTGAMLQGGIQYYSLPGKKWKHQVGLTSSITTGLQGELTTEYTEGEEAVKKEVERGRSFKLPVTIGIGYSTVKNDQLSLSVEANYYHWQYQKVNYAGSFTNPSVRLSGGFEYSFRRKETFGVFEKSFLSAGLSIENSYLKIKNNNLWNYAISLGGGKNISRAVSIYTGIELGSRGNKSLGQIKENYTQFIIGLTFKDIWVGPKYSNRYD